MIYVGIDVGGTGIQVGLVDESGKILCKGGIVTRTAYEGETFKALDGQEYTLNCR